MPRWRLYLDEHVCEVCCVICFPLFVPRPFLLFFCTLLFEYLPDYYYYYLHIISNVRLMRALISIFRGAGLTLVNSACERLFLRCIVPKPH